MSEQPPVVATGPSNIRNPYHALAVFEIALGVGLGWLVLRFVWGLADRAQDLLSGHSWDFAAHVAGAKGPAEAVLRHLETGLVPFVAVAAAALAACCAVQAVLSVAGGIRRFLSFAPASGLPYAIEHAERTAEDLFEKQLVNPARLPAWPQRLLSVVLTPRVLVMSRHLAFLPEDLGRSTFWWAFFLALLCVPCFLGEALAARLGLVAPWPLPVSLAKVAAAALVVRLVSLAASTPRMPQVSLYEQSKQAPEAGHPNAFFDHLRRALDGFRREDAPNRELRVYEPTLDRVRQGETDRFSGQIMVETQPEHRPRIVPLNALLMDAGAAVLLLTGFHMLMVQVLPASRFLAETARIQVGLEALAALVAVAAGVKLLRMGRRLHDIARFHSDLYWIRADGTFTSSKVGLGDGRGSQMYTERAVFQAEAQVRVLGARVVTESAYLEGERLILNTRRDAEFAERVQRLADAAVDLEARGGKLAGIDLQARPVQEIVQANLQIGALSAAASQGLPPVAQPTGLAPGQGQTPGLPTSQPRALPGEQRKLIPQAPQTAADQDAKVCPECAETVKRAARKCRFCGYRFDQGPAT